MTAWFIRLTYSLLGWHWVNIGTGVLADEGHPYTHVFRRVRWTPLGRPFVKVGGHLVFLDDPQRPFTPLTWVNKPEDRNLRVIK